MRLHNGVRMLAALTATAAITASPAYAKFDNSTYPPLGPVHAGSGHAAGGSTDWALIGVGAAGGITLLGAGIATSRRRTASVRSVRPASGS